jgi:hypothetical protein
MSSLITRGYYKYNRIITRGYGVGWLGIVRAEILRFVSKFVKIVSGQSKFTKGC